MALNGCAATEPATTQPGRPISGYTAMKEVKDVIEVLKKELLPQNEQERIAYSQVWGGLVLRGRWALVAFLGYLLWQLVRWALQK